MNLQIQGEVAPDKRDFTSVSAILAQAHSTIEELAGRHAVGKIERGAPLHSFQEKKDAAAICAKIEALFVTQELPLQEARSAQ